MFELLLLDRRIAFLFFNLRKKADSSTVSDVFLFSATHNWLAEMQKEENPNERKLTPEWSQLLIPGSIILFSSCLKTRREVKALGKSVA